MTATSDAVVDAAYKILDRHALVKHYHCTPGPDDCLPAVHERTIVARVALAVLAAAASEQPNSKPLFRQALQRAFR